MGGWRIKNSAGKIVAIALGAIFAVFFVLPVFAAAPQLNLGLEYASATGLANTDIRMIIAKIIRVALGLLGMVALVFTIYGGWMYMTAGGNEEKVATAKKILLNMAIGLAIILSALGIVQFIISAIYSEYEAQYGGGEEPAGFSEEYTVGGFLGSVIESHYPKRNAPWPGEPPIPRNTRIVITFRDRIEPSTLFRDTNNSGVYGDVVSNVADQINDINIKIYATADKEAGALGMNPGTPEDDVYAYLSADGRTIVLRPKNSLGDGQNNVNYTVGFKNGVKLLDGTLAFGDMGSPYSWQFTVSPKDDLTPPQVQSIIPLPSTSAYPRNIIVQINFNEAVDPISASGFFKSGTSKNFQNITVASSTGQLVNGEYRITNQYRAIEFVSDTQCGVNPCGQPVFCLPANDQLTIKIKAAPVDPANPPQALSVFPNGVVDMANNSLDGGGELTLVAGKIVLPPLKDGLAQGPPSDNFFWKFNTSAVLDLTAPFVTNIQPNKQAENVSPTAPITVDFNKPMSLSSFNQITLKTNKDFNVWYTPEGLNYKNATQLVSGLGDVVHHSQAKLLHGAFWKKSAISSEANAHYFTFFDSRLNDIYQNCFYKAIGPGCTATALGGDTNPNRSCYNGTVNVSTSTCQAGEVCPFSPTPFNPSP